MKEKEMVGDVPADLLGTLADITYKVAKKVITPEELKRFARRENPFAADGATDRGLVRKTAKLLSKRFGRTIEVDPVPAEFTEANLTQWAAYNLKPIFLPDEYLSDERRIKNWIKLEPWFYKEINEKKLAAESIRLFRGWYLTDFTLSADYNNGTQVFHNDPLAPLIELLRKEKKIGKYDLTPAGSRFAITNDEWREVLLPALAEKLGFPKERVRLERAIEFNAIGNLYDQNRGKFSTWEWFYDAFGDSNRLCGGYRKFGGLADVGYGWQGRRDDDIAGRPLVSFAK